MLNNNKKSGTRFVMEKGYYEILEIPSRSTTLDIRRAFENLCDEHVDIYSEDSETRKRSAEILFALTKAYEVLTDPFQRHAYDERKFGDNQPFNNEVETIFKEGLKAFRNNNLDNSIRFFKEAVYLLPHKVNYRVNLAIAYAEKGWKEYAEKELRMALKLEPENQFAQEVVARLLFRVSDKKKVGFLSQKVNRQLTAIAAASLLTCGVLVTGIPAMASLLNSKEDKKPSVEELTEMNNQLPSEMRKAIQNKAAAKPKAPVNISKLANDFVPSGEVYDYTNKEAVKKTFYSSQNMIVVEYKDGSILTYKTHDLLGWKKDLKTNTPVVITKANEIIPVSVTIPVTLSDGRTVTAADADFPAAAFPEYEINVKSAKAEVAPAPAAAAPETAAAPVENVQPAVQAPVAEVAPVSAVTTKAPPIGLPPSR